MSRVLFVCLHNAGRSQMSEALFRKFAGGRHESRSAGTQPAERIHPQVASVMLEVGIDLAHQTPKRLTHEMAEWADLVVTMGCGDECPFIPGKRYLDWDLPDPARRHVDEVRVVREAITALVKDLVSTLDEERSSATGDEAQVS